MMRLTSQDGCVDLPYETTKLWISGAVDRFYIHTDKDSRMGVYDSMEKAQRVMFDLRNTYYYHVNKEDLIPYPISFRFPKNEDIEV